MEIVQIHLYSSLNVNDSEERLPPLVYNHLPNIRSDVLSFGGAHPNQNEDRHDEHSNYCGFANFRNVCLPSTPRTNL